MTADAELQRIQLTRGLHLWQRRAGHRTGTDDVVAAWAALSARPHARTLLDLGAGHGSVALMLAAGLDEARIVAVEVQATSFALLRRNVADNGLCGRIEPVLGDLRSISLAGGPFELITGTPPFMPLGSGVLPRDPQRAAARFELHGGVEDYCAAAAGHLAPGGLASLVMDAARPERYRAAFAAAGLRLRRLIRVLPSPGRSPTYLVCQGEGGAGPEAVEESTLVVRTPEGAWTPEFEALRRRLDLPSSG